MDRAAADRAIVQREFGPPEVLRQEEVPPPEPGEGRVRIAVEAAGVHVIDTSIRAGSAILPFPLPELPMTPGREVAGAVDAVGPGVDASWRCRRVVPHLVMASGGYAERAVASAAALHEVPERLEAATAVAAIGTGRTAVGILDEARIAPADVVLATAAAGGLGSLFVQAACSAGATAVEGAGGAAKAERVRALGADVVVDDLAPGWGERVIDALGGRRPAVVLNCVGGALGREAADLLAPGGRLILLGYSSGELTPSRRATSSGWASASPGRWEPASPDGCGSSRHAPWPRPPPAASSRSWGDGSPSPTPPQPTAPSRPATPSARRCFVP